MSCVIDGSHMRASDLDYLIIKALTRTGVVDSLTADDLALVDRAADDYYRAMSELSDDDVEELRCIAEDCIDAWNDRHNHLYVTAYVEDSCLWIETLEC